MQVSGKLVIIFIFGTALAGGIATLWFHYEAHRRSREFWGSENAVLISRASQVELLRLSPAVDLGHDDQLTIDNTAFEIVERKDISKARGLVHVRDALIRDTGFNWDEELGDCQPNWEFAARFAENGNSEIIAFDFHCERVRLVSGGQEACISPILEGIKELIDREMPEEESEPKSTEKTEQ